ncbi:MAG: universal stress protein [Scytonematopsis contorta HA4267-MV1]|jgi:nucleotide-binding universal stress UspA family protein|nr:universal stress protein [Scytonematopsis contorta HA4267-MV1]
MFNKILVALNRSDNMSQYVFEDALELAKATKSSLKLLHVLSVDDKDSPNILALINTPENKKRWEEFEKPGIDLLKALADKANAAGIATEYYQGLGRPGYIICETARVWEAGLIMIGRRGLSGMSELILGSVSNYVTHYAPCSVLVVQAPEYIYTEKISQKQIATAN